VASVSQSRSSGGSSSQITKLRYAQAALSQLELSYQAQIAEEVLETEATEVESE
jgi:hypothetical protein